MIGATKKDSPTKRKKTDRLEGRQRDRQTKRKTDKKQKDEKDRETKRKKTERQKE